VVAGTGAGAEAVRWPVTAPDAEERRPGGESQADGATVPGGRPGCAAQMSWWPDSTRVCRDNDTIPRGIDINGGVRWRTPKLTDQYPCAHRKSGVHDDSRGTPGDHHDPSLQATVPATNT
jgi:hypothetical protein